MSQLPAGASALLLLLFVPRPATAQVSCADIEFAADMVAEYPLISDACLGVVERNGQQYVRLHARVAANHGESLMVEYMHNDGQWGPYVEITPPDDYRPRIGGLPTPWRRLRARQEMNFYIPEGRWTLASAMAEPDSEAVEMDEPPPVEEPAEVVERVAERSAEPPPPPAEPAPEPLMASPAPARAEPVEPAPLEPAPEPVDDDPVDAGTFLLWYGIAVGVALLGIIGSIVVGWRRSA